MKHEKASDGEGTSRYLKWMRENIEGFLAAFVFALIAITFVARPFKIPSGSMSPTLRVGDRIFVNRFIYAFSHPRRGDIIVFIYPGNPRKDYIKRVAATGEEEVEIRDHHLYVDGERVNEPPEMAERIYYRHGPYGKRKVKVPEGSLYVLGDNSGNSKDSRIWGFVPEENLKGKAFFIYWPPHRIGLLQ